MRRERLELSILSARASETRVYTNSTTDAMNEFYSKNHVRVAFFFCCCVMVGVVELESTTLASQTRCATRLRYTPNYHFSKHATYCMRSKMMVGQGGLEPPHHYWRQDLNLQRLPISPLTEKRNWEHRQHALRLQEPIPLLYCLNF